MALRAWIPAGFELLAKGGRLGWRGPRRTKPRFVLGVGELLSPDVAAAANGEVIEVVLPGLAEPIRVLGPEGEQVVHDVLEVEGAVARAQLEDSRQETPQVAQDRENLGRKVRIL